MSASDAERATADLDVGLRLAGVGRLFDRLAGDDTLIRPSVWCPGRCETLGAVIAADADTIAILRISATDAEPEVRVVDVRDVERLSIDPSMRGFTLHLGEDDVVVTDAPRTRLAAFVAHLITRLPATRQRPDLNRPGGPS